MKAIKYIYAWFQIIFSLLLLIWATWMAIRCVSQNIWFPSLCFVVMVIVAWKMLLATSIEDYKKLKTAEK